MEKCRSTSNGRYDSLKWVMSKNGEIGIVLTPQESALTHKVKPAPKPAVILPTPPQHLVTKTMTASAAKFVSDINAKGSMPPQPPPPAMKVSPKASAAKVKKEQIEAPPKTRGAPTKIDEDNDPAAALRRLQKQQIAGVSVFGDPSKRASFVSPNQEKSSSSSSGQNLLTQNGKANSVPGKRGRKRLLNKRALMIPGGPSNPHINSYHPPIQHTPNPMLPGTTREQIPRTALPRKSKVIDDFIVTPIPPVQVSITVDPGIKIRLKPFVESECLINSDGAVIIANMNEIKTIVGYHESPTRNIIFYELQDGGWILDRLPWPPHEPLISHVGRPENSPNIVQQPLPGVILQNIRIPPPQRIVPRQVTSTISSPHIPKKRGRRPASHNLNNTNIQ